MALSRRYFFFGSVLAGAIPKGGFGSTPSLKAAGYKSPNEKLNIASIGAGGKAASDIDGCSKTENIVALCDVDDKSAAKTFEKFDKAPKYKDFRKMLDKEGPGIDGVIVTIPDFMHATAAMWCMERGKHVYVQKPLTRTVWEARELMHAAAKYKVATQMGNQGYSNEGTRECAEMIWSGAIGNVTEVHAWTNRPIWPQGMETLPDEKPVPDTLDWDSWLGIQSMRPYSPAYLPFNWRGWLDFGCGSLGDMACHILGAPNMALRLGAPTSVECTAIEGKSKYAYPKKSTIRFDFPARGTMPPVKVYWYDAAQVPPFRPKDLGEDELLGDLPRRRPNANPARQARQQQQQEQQPAAAQDANTRLDAAVSRAAGRGSNGSLFVGDKGYITTGTYGEGTRLLPADRMKDYQMPPEFLTRSPGHYRDWIRACKGGERSCSDFSVAAPFTEWILLGVIALHFDGKLDWDSAKMRFTNRPEANALLKPTFRKGWQFS
jgi:predicted dehydrogenase